MGNATVSFPAHPSALAKVREFVRRRAEEVRLGARAAEELVLAVSEASTNVVLHSGSPSFEVAWRSSDQTVEVEVRDAGAFRRRVRIPEVEGAGGYGIPLMTALTDALVIEEGSEIRPGTVVRLVKRLGG